MLQTLYDLYRQDLCETREHGTKKQFTTAIQKAIHLVRRLHLGIIWAKCKVKKSNCIPPDPSDAILYCNKMVSWLSENLGPDSSITHSKTLWKLDFNSKSCRSRLTFFQVAIAEWKLISFLICLILDDWVVFFLNFPSICKTNHMMVL